MSRTYSQMLVLCGYLQTVIDSLWISLVTTNYQFIVVPHQSKEESSCYSTEQKVERKKRKEEWKKINK